MPNTVARMINDRVLIADLDSTMQANLVRSWQKPDIRELNSNLLEERLNVSLGRLRLETLLSEKIVVTDSQMFDGSLLTRVASAGKLGLLRREPDLPMPLELRLRHESPAKALWLMYHKESGHAKSFMPSLFSNGHALSTAFTGLNKGSPRPFNVGDEIRHSASLLQSAGGIGEEIDEAVDAWTKILESCNSGALPVAVYKMEEFEDFFNKAEARWNAESVIKDHCLTPPARELMKNVQHLGIDRSAVHGLLKSVLSSNPDEDLRRAAEMIMFRYDERYRRAQAFQHGANYRGTDSGLFSKSLDATLMHEGIANKLVEIQLPAGLLEFMGTLNLNEWQRVVQRHQSNLRKWWDGGDIDALRRILDYLSKLSDEVNGRPDECGSSVQAFVRWFEVGIGAWALFLKPDAIGVSTVILIRAFKSLVEMGATVSPTMPSVEVTDYVNDRAFL
jgi:hypothetical protein